MEKKDFEKTFEKVAELNKQLREECCDYRRQFLQGIKLRLGRY